MDMSEAEINSVVQIAEADDAGRVDLAEFLKMTCGTISPLT